MKLNAECRDLKAVHWNLFLIVSSLIRLRKVVYPGDEENSAKGVATAEEALKVIPGVVKATID